MAFSAPLGTVALGALDAVPLGPPPAWALADQRGPLFLAAEIEMFRPGSGVAPQAEALGVLPIGALGTQGAAVDDFTIFRASDAGWVTRDSDPAGRQVYPPILLSDLAIDRQMDLGLNGAGVAAAWGDLRLVNDRQELSTLAATTNADARPVRIMIGRKQVLPHGAWRDPEFGATATLLSCHGGAWVEEAGALRLPLRDAGGWLDLPMDGPVYDGTGGLSGTAELAGKRKPWLRGGTAGAPVVNITPTLVDPIAGIYQISDAPGAVVALYERGLAGGIALNAIVADITGAAPPAGTYDVESSARGLFVRLGTMPPAGPITVDAWGLFPDFTAASDAARVALEILKQDVRLAATDRDDSAFVGLGAARPWPAGWYMPAGDNWTAGNIIGLFVRSAGARLIPLRNGRLSVKPLSALPPAAPLVANYGPHNAVACDQRPGAPPPWRARVGWRRNHTVQTSDLAPTVTAARRQELAEAWRVSEVVAASVLSAWRRPMDPPLVETALTSGAGADALAGVMAALWCVASPRRVYDLQVPLASALRHEIGDAVQLAWPGALGNGAIGQIVGEQMRLGDATTTFQVLI